MEGFFQRLETYIEVTPTTGMRGTIVNIMVQMLTILAIATKEIKQNRASELIPIINPFFLLTIVQRSS